jgi:hypothetical protein
MKTKDSARRRLRGLVKSPSVESLEGLTLSRRSPIPVTFIRTVLGGSQRRKSNVVVTYRQAISPSTVTSDYVSAGNNDDIHQTNHKTQWDTAVGMTPSAGPTLLVLLAPPQKGRTPPPAYRSTWESTLDYIFAYPEIPYMERARDSSCLVT